MKQIFAAALAGLCVGALCACSSVSKTIVRPEPAPSKPGAAPVSENIIAGKPYFDWPVNQARMTRGFFTHPARKKGRPHLGIDLAAAKNTPILSAHNGLVIYVGREFKGYGRVVMVEGKDGYASLYAHLAKATVRPGQEVKQGQQVGLMGRTGHATGVHLHFEIRRQTGPVDPLNYLPRAGSVASSQSR